MDNNQKLVSQIADLSRNLNIVNESLKRNTQGIQTLIENQQDRETNTESASETQATGIVSISKELKEISGALSKLSSPDSPFSKMAEAFEKSGGQTFDFGTKGEIKGKFQTGGVAKEEGKYIVGENGPEVVSLPKGSGVIPINTKDLIEGLRKVPQLSDLLKDSDVINVTGDNYSKSILSADGKRISLNRLITQYEDDSIELDVDADPKGKETLEMLEKNLKSLESLEQSVDQRLSEELQMIREEKTKLDEKRGRPETPEEFSERIDKASDILNTLPPEERTELAVAKATLEAQKIMLNKAGENTPAESQGKESAESIAVKTDLKKINTEAKNPETEGKSEKGSSEKGPGLFSKLGDQLKKSAGRVAEGVAQQTGLGGAFSLAKKGIGALSEKMKSEESAKAPTTSPTPEAPKIEKSSIKLAAPAPKSEAPVETPKPSTPPAPTPTPTVLTQTESTSTMEKSSGSKTSTSATTMGQSNNITTEDINAIKGALARIASLLEGPLTVSQIEEPFRPNSRRV
jgi:hypothetical protein